MRQEIYLIIWSYSKFKPNEVMDTFRYIYPDTDSIYSIDEIMMYVHGTSK